MMEVDEEEAMEQGVDSFLPKPFDFADLCEAIERALSWRGQGNYHLDFTHK
jgi:FixJ family two-component response regulator